MIVRKWVLIYERYWKSSQASLLTASQRSCFNQSFFISDEKEEAETVTAVEIFEEKWITWTARGEEWSGTWCGRGVISCFITNIIISNILIYFISIQILASTHTQLYEMGYLSLTRYFEPCMNLLSFSL